MSFVDSAVKIAFTVMNYIEEQKFRAQVIEVLTDIGNNLQRIADGLVRIEVKVDHDIALGQMNKFLASLNGADVDIATYYKRDEIQDWLDSGGKKEVTDLYLIDNINRNVKNNLIKIHDAIIGTVDNPPWLNLHIAIKRFEDLPTSMCENVFHYFTGHLLSLQLKGLVLLTAVSEDKAELEEFTKKLKSHFREQGNVCQGIVDKLPENDFWWGCSDISDGETYSCTNVRVGLNPWTPENHVLVGFEVVNENGTLVIKRFHGKANSAGMVENVEMTIAEGKDTHEFAGRGRLYMNITKNDLPPGHVLVDVAFCDEYPAYPASDDELYLGLEICYLHAKMNPDGTLDMRESMWERSKGSGAFPHPPFIPPEARYFTPWRAFSSTPQLHVYGKTLMTTALTGYQCYPSQKGKFNSAVKVDIHRNSFAEKE